MAAEPWRRTDLLAHEVRVVRGRVGLCQHVPLGPFDIGFTHDILPTAGAMRLDGRPDRGCIVLVDSRQRPGLLQGLHRHRHLGFGIEIFEKLPAILDQLTERVFGLRNRERRERDGEPAIRGPQQNCASLFITFILEVIQVGMTPSATRKILFSGFSKGVRHASGCPTGITLHPQVFGLQRCAALEEAQRALARTVAAVDEVMPREVIEMTIAAGQQKTRGNGIRILGRLVAFGATAAFVNEAGSLRPEAVLLDLEQTGIEGRQQAALHAAHPAREWPNGNTDIGLGRPDVDEFTLLEGRHPQVLDLRPQNLPNGSKQSCLLDRLAAILFPSIDAECHYGKAGQVDQRTGAISPQQLAGAYFADWRFVVDDHVQSSSFVAGRGFQS